MPTNLIRPTAFIQAANPASVNVTTANDYAPGEIGQVYKDATGRWQKVILDSGATPTPAASLLVFWKARNTYTVTTKLADSTRNNVAGVLMGAPTAGNVFWMLIGGDNITVTSAAGAAGDLIIANSGANADAINIAAGTAPTYTVIGPVKTAVSGGVVGVDVALGAAV